MWMVSFGFVVLLWRQVWFGEICEDSTRSWPSSSFEDWPLCLCWMELWVCFCSMYVNDISFVDLYIPPCFKILCYGRGFPIWLHFIPGIQFRTTNAPFKVGTCTSVEIGSRNKCSSFKWFYIDAIWIRELFLFIKCRMKWRNFLQKLLEWWRRSICSRHKGGQSFLLRFFFFHRLATSSKNDILSLNFNFLHAHFLYVV